MLNKTVFDVASVLLLLRAVVADAGEDHVPGAGGSNGCQYVKDPHAYRRLVSICIVGRLFDYLGILRALVNVTETGDVYEQYGACLLNEPMWERAEAMGVQFTEDAKVLLRLIQNQQDSDEPWGKAVTIGIEEFRTKVIEDALADKQVPEGTEDRWLHGMRHRMD